ncbi:MAG: DUF402 domain-containing protein [Lachnospiraceae bacterium]
MSELSLYRKRLIPNECIRLKDDIIIKQDEDVIVTSWKTLNPKIAFQYGASCYFLKEGYKVSKFYRADGSLYCWYCDIVQYDFDSENNALTITDLLADVIIKPDGTVKVVDLDELAEAFDKGLLDAAALKSALLNLNNLLTLIYADKFCRLEAELNDLEL